VSSLESRRPRTAVFAACLLALFAFRLGFGLSSEFMFEDETQIFLNGLRHYTTGEWPYFGPDVVWTKSEIPGALQGVLISTPMRIVPVPEAAVQYEGSGAFVYRIASDGERSTAQRIEVQTGAVEAGMVEILQGLDAGDRVIGSGLNRIQPGAAVQVANASAASPSAPEGGAVTRTSAP